MRSTSIRYIMAVGFSLSAASFAGLAGSESVAVAQHTPDDASPVFGVTLPNGYRDWTLVSVAHEAGANNDIRAILGNDIAVKAFREGKRPFPDGSVIMRLAWEYKSSARNDAVFPAPQSFVAGEPTNVQVSVKDSKRYAASAGWGYGQFENGRANHDASLVQKCLPVTPSSTMRATSSSRVGRVEMRTLPRSARSGAPCVALNGDNFLHAGELVALHKAARVGRHSKKRRGGQA